MFFLGSCNTTYALEEIGQSKLHPASPLYFLKIIRENLEMKFAGNRKIVMIRRLEFATRRLREVKSLILANKFELIIPALENYWFQINSIPDKELGDQKLIAMIANNLSTHLEILENLYPNLSDVRVKMAIRTAINRLVQRLDMPNSTREHGCNFLAKEATMSSLLNETEKAVLKMRSEKCFKIMKEIY